jgi:hypothetical protein
MFVVLDQPALDRLELAGVELPLYLLMIRGRRPFRTG